MQFIILRKTYDSFGSCPALDECARRIARHFGEVAFGLEAVEIIASFETTAPTRPSLEGLRARFRQEFQRLPIVRFEGKRQRIRLAYASRVALAGERQQLPPESLGEFFDELVCTMDSLRPALMKKPGLDFTGFVDAVRAIGAAVREPNTEERSLNDGTDESAVASTPWWQAFGIDWSRYHPRAREILNVPFYWDPANDHAPHGATNGAALLADFRRWRAQHPIDLPWDFLRERFRRPGCLGAFNEFRATDPANYESRQGYIAQWHDRDVIALAFALLKIDGVCDKTIGAAALQALVRRRDPALVVKLGWNVVPESIAIASRLQDDLQKRL